MPDLTSTTAAYADLAAELAQRGPAEVRIDVGDGTYAEIIAAVAMSRAATSRVPITAPRLGWLLTGLGYRETTLGTSKDCDHRGPGCTGDFGARLATPRRQGARYQVVQQLPPGWSPPRDEHGQVIAGPYSIPADGRGFGRDEWQADYDAHPEVVDARDADGTPSWMRSRYACDQAAARFLSDLSTLGQERQALAAYNCGCGGVRRALDTGHTIDWNTKGRNYSAWILEHVSGWCG